MFAKWFSRSKARPRHGAPPFWPQLESLEDRLPPSAMHGEGPGTDMNPHHMAQQGNQNHQGNQNQQGDQRGDRDDRHGDRGRGDDRDHQDNPFNPANFNCFFQNSPGQLVQSFQQVMHPSSSALSSLIHDEVSLAQDQILLAVDGLMGITNPALQSTITGLQNDISNNAAEQTATGQLAGNVAYDLTLLSIVSGAGHDSF